MTVPLWQTLPASSGRHTLPSHPARGVARVHIGPRSGARIPDGPHVEPPLDVDELKKLLVRLREGAW